MEHLLNIGESVTLTVYAKDEYSPEKLLINKGEEYSFSWDGNQLWKDSFIKTTPKGYFNILALLYGLRIKKAKCFCLCGAYNESDKSAIAICIDKKEEMQESGSLSFFANDSPGYYNNNSGQILVRVTRIK